MTGVRCWDGCGATTEDPRGLWWYWDRVAQRYVCPECWEKC